MDTYQPETIEKKWQEVWEAERAFYAPNPEPGAEPERKFYMLEMLPYPSGTLHMGHVLNYTLGDVLTHFRRRNGWTVMRPMGWDAFGLPPEYYRWTQWLFLKLFEAGLAYRKKAPVNWCPKDQTVVANEYVIDGKCERCGTPVVAKNMEQWFFR